jgi:hypothetical protein
MSQDDVPAEVGMTAGAAEPGTGERGETITG